MPAHDHRAIMEWRLRVEDADQQIVTQFGIQLYPAVNDVLEPDIALYHDQRAGLGGGQRGGGEHNLVVNTFAELPVVLAREGHTEPVTEGNQCLTNFGLEEHDDGDADVEQGSTEDECQ